MAFKNPNNLKPIYKKLLRLKLNVYNKKKFFSLKKKKWQKYLFSIKFKKKLVRSYKYDCCIYQRPKFTIRFKTKYRFLLFMKQKFSLFYGGLLKRYLKRNIKKAKKIYLKNYKNDKVFLLKNFYFLELLEKRIDVILFRSYFVNSIKKARQAIFHGHVFLNDKKVNNCSCLIKKSNVIKLKKNVRLYYELIKKEKKNFYFSILPPKYLFINYKTSQIFLIKEIKLTKLINLFTFSININSIVKRYSL